MHEALLEVQAEQARIEAILWEQHNSEREAYLQELREHVWQIKTSVADHGSRTRYNYGCRCEKCRRANREYSQRYREAKGQVPRKRATHGSKTMYGRGCRCAACVAHHKGEYRRESPIPHGTHRGYVHRKCRCDKCRDAYRKYQRKLYAKKEPTQNLPPNAHGKVYTYVYHKCRCLYCRTAHAEYLRQRRAARKAIDNANRTKED